MEENVVVKQQYCSAVRQQVQLVETRVFPESDFLSMDEYRVKKTEATTGRYVATDYTKCIGCHICADVCPTGYIQMGLGE